MSPDHTLPGPGTARPPDTAPRRILVAGATGYIGRFVVRELVARGHAVASLSRRPPGPGAAALPVPTMRMLEGSEVRVADVCDPGSLMRQGIRGERFDAAVSCLASRTGVPGDAWRIDYAATRNVLEAARQAGAGHFVLLSALCVQKPRLEFQRAKLAMEAELKAAGLTHSIVRPTAFFKSLAGQVARVKRGRPFLVFGDGGLTATRPIAEADLARYLADCLEDPDRWNRVLPVGGPGEAITPRQQGEMLFELLGREPRIRRVPPGIFDAAAAVLGPLGRLFPALADKAELARIGRYYATESMLVLDPLTGRYDAAATPAYGTETLRAVYARVLAEGTAGQELGDHAIFK